MQLTENQKKIFAMLFASGDPLETEKMAEVLQIKQSSVREDCKAIIAMMTEEELPIELKRLEDCWQFCTREEYDEVIRQALQMRQNAPLSSPAMETLAIIAYNQPVTRSYIEQVRGVENCSSVVETLIEKNLVEEAGRLDLPGRPIAFRTTSNFLRCFNLSNLKELPEIIPQDEIEKEENDQLEFSDINQVGEKNT